jgi:hypothetical protein
MAILRSDWKELVLWWSYIYVCVAEDPLTTMVLDPIFFATAPYRRAFLSLRRHVSSW